MTLHTKALMGLSSAVMLALGLLMTFAAQEVSAFCGSPAAALPDLLVQAAGALYLGFAMLNWMAKSNLIGGIYSRPVAMGNFIHFFAVAMALVKAVGGGHREAAIVVLTVPYLVLAVWFGLVLFGSPVGRAAVDTPQR